MTILDYLKNKIVSTRYYETRFPAWNSKFPSTVRCVFHDDNSPSLSLNLSNGGARCHAASCSMSIGNIAHFESVYKGITEDIAARKLYNEFVRPVISKKLIAKYREGLATNPSHILKINKELGLSRFTQKAFSIGYDALGSKRVVIPVYNEFDMCINFRHYRLPSERGPGDSAKIYNEKGYGGVDLFPAQKWKDYSMDKPVVFLAAEKEVMLAWQAGVQAVCSTAGEGSYNPDWDGFFAGRDVIIALNIDEAGVNAATKVQASIASVAKSATVVTLPFRQRRKDWKDFSDWVLRDGNKARNILSLAKIPKAKKDAPKIPHQSRESIEIPELSSTKLENITNFFSKPELLGQHIRTQGKAISISTRDWSIFWKYAYKCKDRDPGVLEIPISRSLIQFLGNSDEGIHYHIGKMVGGGLEKLEPLKPAVHVNEVEIIPIATSDDSDEYKVQRCFYFGPKIETNIPYQLDIIPVTDPKSQRNVGLITNYVPIAKKTDTFDMTDIVYADLCAFQPEGEETVWDKLASIANLVATHYTKILDRMDWHLVALLTWCSPIGFKLPDDEGVERGQMNTLAIGDTETGKSKVSRALQKLFGCGAYVSAENCSYVGLIGGVVKTSSSDDAFTLRWGTIPINDKQLVVVEELSGLSIEDISRMSDVRSSGIARLDKGGIHSETKARTRLLCLSNVRGSKKNLGKYLHGVEAVEDLVGRAEDIARFDLIITLVDKEVSSERLLARNTSKEDAFIPDGSFKSLVHFIWSLPPEKVYVTDDAYDECLRLTRKLSTEYHPEVNIFKLSSGKTKLARIATAIACLTFSEKKGGIVVLPAHMRAAAKLLRRLYNKKSFGYKAYSEQMYINETTCEEDNLREVLGEHVAEEFTPATLKFLINCSKFTREELLTIAELTPAMANQITGQMARSRVVAKGTNNSWEITGAGRKLLKQFLTEQQQQQQQPKKTNETNTRRKRKNLRIPNSLQE